MRRLRKARHTFASVRRCSAVGASSSGNVRRVARGASAVAASVFAARRQDGGLTMASAMRKMAVYLGLVEDGHRYDDAYTDEYADGDDYDDYITEYTDSADSTESRAAYTAEADQDGRGR